MSDSDDDFDMDAALADLPVFPLAQVVLFPRAILPLHVFEPRYRALLKDCLATHRAMAIVLVPDPEDLDEKGHPRIARVGGLGVVVESQSMSDGRSNIVLHGRGRVRLDELEFVPPYRRARATLLEDKTTPLAPLDRSALLSAANAFTTAVNKRDPDFTFGLPPSLPAEAIADLCAHHLVVDATVRQSILEEPDGAERVRMVIRELAEQNAILLREHGGLLN
ncbi:MAG: LON peptidase substrate-binding domain-containing protein [Polyangiaceae bacterium]